MLVLKVLLRGTFAILIDTPMASLVADVMIPFIINIWLRHHRQRSTPLSLSILSCGYQNLVYGEIAILFMIKMLLIKKQLSTNYQRK